MKAFASKAICRPTEMPRAKILTMTATGAFAVFGIPGLGFCGQSSELADKSSGKGAQTAQHADSAANRFEQFPPAVRKAFDDFVACSKTARILKIKTQRPDEYMACNAQVFLNSDQIKEFSVCFKSRSIWTSAILPSHTQDGAKDYLIGLTCPNGLLLAVYIEEKGGFAWPNLVEEIMR